MKKIPNFSNYTVDENGFVYSLNYKRTGKTVKLKPANEGGYLQTMILSDERQYKTMKVHRMVALAYLGDRPPNFDINHINGIKHDNRPINLEYVSHSENCQHSFDLGLQKPKQGILNGMAKLTNEQVISARKQKQDGGRFWGRNELAKSLGISSKHLQKIVNGKYNSWMNV